MAKRIASENPETAALPLRFALEQNYPNSADGKEIVTLVHTKQSAGYYSVAFDGSKFESGVYIYRIKAGKYSAVKKMLLVK